MTARKMANNLTEIYAFDTIKQWKNAVSKGVRCRHGKREEKQNRDEDHDRRDRIPVQCFDGAVSGLHLLSLQTDGGEARRGQRIHRDGQLGRPEI